MEATRRTKLGRHPERGSHELAAVTEILDAALLCHVAFVVDGEPRQLPTAFARVGDVLYLHGSPRSGIGKAGAAGASLCICVSLCDGLVLARSAMHHSMNFRSVVLFGQAREVVDDSEKQQALDALMEQLLPGRSRETRPPDPAELGATAVIAIPLDEASAKVRTGPPVDAARDMKLGHWAGELPLSVGFARPVRDPQLAPDIALPPSVDAVLTEPFIEERRDDLELSNARWRLDVAAIHRYLCEESYWARGIRRNVLERGIANSLCLGIYDGSEQLAFCRLVTDYASFAYLCDVFVVEHARGRGLASWMLAVLQTQPRLATLRRWFLGTRDAHSLYAKAGWQPLAQPDRFMQLIAVGAPNDGC